MEQSDVRHQRAWIAMCLGLWAALWVSAGCADGEVTAPRFGRPDPSAGAATPTGAGGGGSAPAGMGDPASAAAQPAGAAAPDATLGDVGPAATEEGGPDAPQPGARPGRFGEGPWDTGIALEASPQKPGDPEAGYEYLVNAGYFGCGVPARFFGLVQPFATLPGIPNEPLPDRDATVDGLPLGYNWNLAKNEEGVDVVYMNCLQCHAGKFNGELIVGLGNADADWSVNLGDAAGASGLLALLGPTPAEQRELDKFIGRLEVIGQPAVMKTVGTNPAEMLATTFVAHRDRETLAWSREALLTIPALEAAPPGTVITAKTPPWWRMGKKFTQFHTGMGRGDHRRSMMLAGSLCTDSVEQAEAIDAHFNDVAAYIYGIEPPTWPWGVDAALADEGHQVFLSECAGCHGTYAPDEPSYPNLLIPQSEVGTDPAVALGGTSPDYGGDLVDWYNESWYGEVGQYEPFEGYVAPPLDAVWATAPYLHNGSVPDIATLLDSAARPTYWRRVDHVSTNYDQSTLGFPWVELQSGQDLPPFGVPVQEIYDTTQFSHENTGHTYGDTLSDAERRALIEYLKTL